MEAFSLLKYWKGAGAGAPAPSQDTASLLAAVPQNDIETTTTDDDEDDDNDDDGPFFDLEFTVPDEEANDDSEDSRENPNEDDDNDNDNDESEFKLTLSPSTNDRSDPNPSDDLFFKGKLVQLEPNSSEPNSKPRPQPEPTGSLLKSATKFRVFMLGLKKSKPNVASGKDSNAPDSAPKQQEPCEQQQQQQKKLCTVKFKVEEVPIVSLFTRDNSSRGGASNKASQKQNAEESQSQSPSDEKQRFSKVVMHKYLKKVKPLYIRVSKRYAEKLRFSGQLNIPPPPQQQQQQKSAPAKAAEEKAPAEAEASESGGSNLKGQKQGNLPLPAGLRVVCKHLGKSRSASSAAPAPAESSVSSQRRDDSLLQQQDGIQSAILHCKRSFNASRECESSQLPRCVSDPLQEVPTNDVKEKRL